MSRISHLLNADLVQKRKVRVSNGKGGFEESLETLRTVRGRIVPSRRFSVLLAQQRKGRQTHEIFLEPDSEVLVNDEFVFGDRSFRVLVPIVRPSVNIYQLVLTEEIQSG